MADTQKNGKIWSDYLINGGRDADASSDAPYCDRRCRQEKAEQQRRKEEAQKNPWSEQNMKRDALTAGDKMKAYENDDYQGFTTKGGYYGGQIGKTVGQIGGTVTEVPGGSLIGGTIGQSIGRSIGEYFDPKVSIPAIEVKPIR